MSEPEFVFLSELNGSVDVALARSLLEGANLRFFIQAEQHASMTAGMFSGVISPRVHVAREDVEQARSLLAEITAVVPEPAEALENGLCAVHERPATATCGRCGSFLCEQCNALGQPPVCEACSSAEAPLLHARREGLNNRRRLVAAFLLVPIAAVALMTAIALVLGALR